MSLLDELSTSSDRLVFASAHDTLLAESFVPTGDITATSGMLELFVTEVTDVFEFLVSLDSLLQLLYPLFLCEESKIRSDIANSITSAKCLTFVKSNSSGHLVDNARTETQPVTTFHDDQFR
jgi:hypothetical protein